jgi:Ca2+-binding RTX toxin-like protein
MKKATVILLVLFAALAAPAAHAEERVNLLITGGAERDIFGVKLSLDGRQYIIDSVDPLEVGGGLCTHAEGFENRLSCDAATIAGFEVNAGDGNDSAIVSPKIQVPVTLRGGAGNDRLYGAAAADKLVGGSGNDALIGRSGDDALFGGSGDDQLNAGPGDDVLNGGSGENELVGGPGDNTLM